MANIITAPFMAGFRLINGVDLNKWRDQINAAFAGTTAIVVNATSITSSGNITSQTFIDESVAAGLTAVGTNRATALALTKAINVIATAAASTGVVLPSAATVGVGGKVTIYNNGASAIKVYAAGSDTVDGTAGATGVTLTNALRCQYTVTAALTFISAQLGVVSA